MTSETITITAICNKNDDGSFETIEKKVTIKNGGIIYPDYDPDIVLLPFQQASSEMFFAGQHDLGFANLVIFQDPNFIFRSENDVFCYPLPLPLNFQLYHSPLILATANHNMTKFTSCSLETMKMIWKNWTVGSSVQRYSTNTNQQHSVNMLHDDETPTISMADSHKSSSEVGFVVEDEGSEGEEMNEDDVNSESERSEDDNDYSLGKQGSDDDVDETSLSDDDFGEHDNEEEMDEDSDEDIF